MLEIIEKGGPIMWPLLILSIISMAVIIDRIIFYIKFVIQSDNFQTSRFILQITENKTNEAFQIIQSTKDPVLRAAFESDINSKNSFQISFQHNAANLLASIRRGLGVLDTAITLAPLLGLLGTVIGLINAFSSLGINQISAPVAITGGISEALLATAYGLAIAIICLIPFNLISELENKIREKLEEVGTAIEKVLN